jgi:hypothetical protein
LALVLGQFLRFPFSLVSPLMGRLQAKRFFCLLSFVSIQSGFPMYGEEGLKAKVYNDTNGFHSIWFPYVWGVIDGTFFVDTTGSFHSIWFPYVWGDVGNYFNNSSVCEFPFNLVSLCMGRFLFLLVELLRQSFHSIWFPYVWGEFAQRALPSKDYRRQIDAAIFILNKVQIFATST